ncbi:MAG TPA: zinc ribbon domain-containing protein [Thermoanaerobaculia bacterium]
MRVATPGGGAWTVAARFTSIGEAAAARSALDAAEIDTYIANENLVSVDWLYSQAVGALMLMVREGDVERAREVIDTLAGTEPGPADVEWPRAARVHARCSECGSIDLRPIPRLRILVLLTAVFIAIGVAAGDVWLAVTALVAVWAGVFLMPSHRCVSCGNRFSVPPEEEVDAPLPTASDMVEEPCPRCGSLEVHQIQYRRLKSLPLLFAPFLFVVLPIWWFQPKRRCDACGLKLR